MRRVRNVLCVFASSQLGSAGKLRPLPSQKLLHRLHMAEATDTATSEDLNAWGEAAKTYSIHHESRTYSRRLKDLGGKAVAYGEMSNEELRAQFLRRSELFAGLTDFAGSETEFIVPSAGSGGGE